MEMRQRGFTLVEVLVALSIFMVVMGLVLVAFVQIMRSFHQGQEISAREQRERSCLFWMSKDISSIVEVPYSPQNYYLKGEQDEFFFIFARESALAESRYVCNLLDQTLERYSEEPTDYDAASYQKKEVCLQDLVECAFSYSDGLTWKPSWGQEEGELPRMVKITFKPKDTPQAKEFIVNVPVSP
ncbi:MAG: prepilin-type N-terminal cleavage/methylation domain-containing protein [Candidatus Omnitrophica bacterium]|nr:prepilin-type N-terminal cleavage/methylation domain-containing protein [Candidatus Omnitrophota bacterium]MBU4473288.1 prepilin-type N-terminal cleavage/methylation domain-containing protein [Candidatus Omnitrophota bacterium]MCG2706793.1 prepilin-type N-terminal cleavage/methylation domain-containing protein [Candidatus Omnitrophota bacterium]